MQRTLLLLPAMALLGGIAAAQTTYTANVYRDVNGIPHIESETEKGAWYAMGFEEARDGLVQIRFNLKLWTGHAAEFIEPTAKNVINDLLTQKLGVDKSGLTDTQLETLLRLSDGTDRFYDNLVAYTKGINDYITSYASVSSPIKDWIALNHPWMLVPDVTVGEVASYGAAQKLQVHQLLGTIKDPLNQFGTMGACGATGDAGSPSANAAPEQPWLTELRETPSNAMTTGSNSFVWTAPFTYDQNVGYSASIADPHWGREVYAVPQSGPAFQTQTDHTWFCHLRVTPEGATEPTLDSLGFLVHGAGVLLLSHNQDVAVSGSAGPPNILDVVSLKVRGGVPSEPLPVLTQDEYYSHYQDPDGSDGCQPGDWVPFVKQTFQVQTPCGPQSHEIWDAGPFGFVLYPPPSPLPPSKPCGQINFNPTTLNCYRFPIDPNVDPAAALNDSSNHHARLGVAWYEVMHATSVEDVMDVVRTYDAGWLVDYQVIDREGSIFATHLGTIPQRGDDAQIATLGSPALLKWLHYLGTPVPFLSLSDQIWDWTGFTPGTSPGYLSIDAAPVPPTMALSSDWWPHVRYRIDGVGGMTPNQPPTVLPTGGAPDDFENPGFSVLNNDCLYHAWRKRPSSGSALLDQMILTATTYSLAVVCPEANQRNQYVIDALTPILQAGVGVTPACSSGALMSLAQSKKLALDNRWYAALDYDRSTVTPGACGGLASYPVAVRVLEELYTDLTTNGSANGLAARYRDEAYFFEDLWNALFNPAPGSDWASYAHPLSGQSVPLRQVWVDNDPANPVFWYDAGGNPVAIPMPAEAGLIDFHPQATFRWTSGGAPLDTNGLCRVGTALDFLEIWDGDPFQRYRNFPNSRAALLLSMYKRGLEEGYRRWTPVTNGGVLAGTSELSQCTGTLTPLSPDGSLPGLGSLLLQPYLGAYAPGFGMKALGGIDTHTSALATALKPGESSNSWSGFDHTLPLSALYSNQATRTVKTMLSMSDVDALVEFFLQLGGFYDPSTETPVDAHKVERWGSVPNCANPAAKEFAYTRGAVYPPGYPFTRALAEGHLLQRFVETLDYLEQLAGAPGTSCDLNLPTLGSVYRMRVLDITGTQRWPAGSGAWPAGTTPCTGGFLRSVSTFAQNQSEAETIDGFASQILCLGGSGNPLVTFFPHPSFDPPSGPQPPPQSFFWNCQGQNVMDPAAFTSTESVNNMTAYRDNMLLPTHFADYASNLSIPVVPLTYMP